MTTAPAFCIANGFYFIQCVLIAGPDRWHKNSFSPSASLLSFSLHVPYSLLSLSLHVPYSLLSLSLHVPHSLFCLSLSLIVSLGARRLKFQAKNKHCFINS